MSVGVFEEVPVDDLFKVVGVLEVEISFTFEEGGSFAIEVVSPVDVLSDQVNVRLDRSGFTKLNLLGDPFMIIINHTLSHSSIPTTLCYPV